MRMTLLAVLSTALLVSVPATAQPSQTGSASTTAAQSTKVADDAADSDKKVCKRLKTSGTRMAKRACLTEDQWKKVDEQK
jgi:hypothetical protein